MKRIIYVLIGVIIVAGAIIWWLNNRYQKLNKKYSVSIENIKAYDTQLSGLKNDNKVFKLTVDQLNYFNDSILKQMNEVRKQLGIKDKKIEQMQYQLSQVTKSDSIILKDTIFKEPTFKLDTIIGDKWASNHLLMQYPNYIKVTPSFTLESFLFVESKKETIDPPKKFFLLRWFQKKHTVLNITVQQNNPYSETKIQKFVEIIK